MDHLSAWTMDWRKVSNSSLKVKETTCKTRETKPIKAISVSRSSRVDSKSQRSTVFFKFQQHSAYIFLSPLIFSWIPQLTWLRSQEPLAELAASTQRWTNLNSSRLVPRTHLKSWVLQVLLLVLTLELELLVSEGKDQVDQEAITSLDLLQELLSTKPSFAKVLLSLFFSCKASRNALSILKIKTHPSPLQQFPAPFHLLAVHSHITQSKLMYF